MVSSANEYGDDLNKTVPLKGLSGTGLVQSQPDNAANALFLQTKYVHDHNKKVELQQTRRILEVYN